MSFTEGPGVNQLDFLRARFSRYMHAVVYSTRIILSTDCGKRTVSKVHLTCISRPQVTHHATCALYSIARKGTSTPFTRDNVMTRACLRAVSESSTMIFGEAGDEGEVPERSGNAAAEVAESRARRGSRSPAVPFQRSASFSGSMPAEPGAMGAAVVQSSRPRLTDARSAAQSGSGLRGAVGGSGGG